MDSGFLDKVLQFIGLQEAPLQETVEEQSRNEVQPPPSGKKKKRGQVISIADRPSSVRVVVLEPEDYEDVAGVAEHLKIGRPIIIRLEKIERKVARRIVDFVSGATFALDGSVRRISEGIFLFTPANVEVDTQAAVDSLIDWPDEDDESIYGE